MLTLYQALTERLAYTHATHQKEYRQESKPRIVPENCDMVEERRCHWLKSTLLFSDY